MEAVGRAAVSFDLIPPDLAQLDRWVCWRWELDPKTLKWKKPPYCVADLTRHASDKTPSDWAPFERALAVVEAGKANGVGFALLPPFVGVDLDKELSEQAQQEIIRLLNSYTDVSPSGEGYHVLVRANLNGSGRHPEGIGVFQRDRFWYCTGEHVAGTPRTIEERQAELDAVLDRFLPKPTPAAAPRPVQRVDLDDDELIERAFAAKNGADFRRLYEGAWQDDYPSQSEAEFAFCCIAAFWTGRDPARIDAWMRSSGLYRDKWHRDGYREATITKAIEGTRDVYEPSRAGVTQPRKSPESPGSPSGGVFRGDSVTQPIRVTGSESPPPPQLEGDSDPESARPFALPSREFIALEREHREPLLADPDGRAAVGRASLTLIGGLGGHGKTTFDIDVFLHMAAGVDYPPWTVPRPVSILLVENEGPEELFAEKLAARLASFEHKLKARLDVCTFDWGGFSLADDATRARLTAEIADKGYDLVFGDPLDSLGIEGVGSPEDTRKFLALMKETGLNKTVAWWLNTHPRKEKTSEALDEIAGAWGGKPDTVFLLRRLEDDRTQLRQPKLRWAKRGQGPTLLFEFDPDTEAFRYLAAQSEEERDYKAETVALLGDGTWRTPKEIGKPKPEGIGANVDTIKDVLEAHPDVFASRTGDAAKQVGRSPSATVWRLQADEDRTARCSTCGDYMLRASTCWYSGCPHRGEDGEP
jgi:hypothetical protein